MGFFITFEGTEGCGKTTQLRLAASFLRALAYDVLTTREPGGTPIGDRVRSILLDPVYSEMMPPAEFFLFSASRAQLVRQVIRPHLARGGVVLSDRYVDSSLAYQGYGHEQDLELLRAISHYATAGLMPDLTVCLDLPVEVGLRRKAGGTGDAWNRMECKAMAFHERVRAGYLAMANQEPSRWIVVDATREAAEVHATVRSCVAARFGLRAGGETE